MMYHGTRETRLFHYSKQPSRVLAAVYIEADKEIRTDTISQRQHILLAGLSEFGLEATSTPSFSREFREAYFYLAT